MPGILGVIRNKQLSIDEQSINAMLRCMIRETFYESGKYNDDHLGITVGWVCHKGSYADCMPVFNEGKDIILIFSGEHFPEDGFENKLRRLGHEFCLSNASSLVHLYETEGEDFLKKLNGNFSGLLIDKRKQKIILFNDRYGLNRCYYHENSAGFYFASEAKALLSVLPELRQLDFNSLAEQLSCGCVLQNRTLFSGVSLLPGGSKWIFEGNNQVSKKKYFDQGEWEEQPRLNGEQYYQNLKETFSRILPKYLKSNRKVGMSLTGGLDGRMIMAWADLSPGELPCYTFNGPYRECADVRIARKIAKKCNQYHKTIKIKDDFYSQFPDLAEKAVYISDGSIDVTGAVELYVNRIASGIAPIRLTGNYGTEILRGLVNFKPGVINDKLWDSSLLKYTEKARETYYKELQCHDVSFIAFKQVPWFHYSRLSLEQSQLTLWSPYLDNDLVALVYQAPPGSIKSFRPSLRLIAAGNPSLAKIPTDRGFVYRPGIPVLNKLKRKWVHFTVKAEYAYNYGMPQWLANFDDKIKFLHPEKLFLGYHKFYHFRVWYRDKFSGYIKSVLLDEKTLSRPYLNRKRVEEMVIGHTKGYRNYTNEISQLMSLELINRLLIEN